MTDATHELTLDTLAEAIRASDVGGPYWGARVWRPARGEARVYVTYDRQEIGYLTLLGTDVSLAITRRAGSVAAICRSVPGVTSAR